MVKMPKYFGGVEFPLFWTEFILYSTVGAGGSLSFSLEQDFWGFSGDCFDGMSILAGDVVMPLPLLFALVCLGCMVFCLCSDAFVSWDFLYTLE